MQHSFYKKNILFRTVSKNNVILYHTAIFRVCAAAEEKTSVMQQMMQERLQYTSALKEMKSYLCTGQSMLAEVDELTTGHTAGHARILTRRAQVRNVAGLGIQLI